MTETAPTRADKIARNVSENGFPQVPECPECGEGKVRFVGRVFDAALHHCDTCAYSPVVSNYDEVRDSTDWDDYLLNRHQFSPTIFRPMPQEVQKSE
jgi:hypothetical protein